MTTPMMNHLRQSWRVSLAARRAFYCVSPVSTSHPIFNVSLQPRSEAWKGLDSKRLVSGKADGSSAEDVIKHTQWFGKASPKLQSALASTMTLVEAEPGHVFFQEGEEITDILIVESGSLLRSKRAEADDAEDSVPNLHDMGGDERIDFLRNRSIVVDRIDGNCQTTGLLHGVHEDRDGRIAFASITACTEEPARVWAIPSQKFRDVISQDPAFALDIIRAISREIHTGSKSLQSLVQSVRFGSRSGQSKNQNVVKVLCYDATNWVRDGFKPAVERFNEDKNTDIKIEMDFTSERLSKQSAIHSAGYDAVCLFVNDEADEKILQTLSLVGVKCVAMRSAGVDRVNVRAAKAYGMTVCRVPAYSPYAVAEHAVALLMAVNRKIVIASNRVKMANFTLDKGLIGMDIYGKTVAVMGTGKIGQCLCNIMLGFGAKVICYDVQENEELKSKGVTYTTPDEIYEKSSVIFLMMPMVEATHHIINEDVLPKLKEGVIIVNTSRGGLVDTDALIKGLRSGIIGGVGMDVYENEGEYFFQDWSAMHLQDPQLTALLGDQNVVLTAHQAFFTQDAVDSIVAQTIDNIKHYQMGDTGTAHPNNCLPTSSSEN